MVATGPRCAAPAQCTMLQPRALTLQPRCPTLQSERQCCNRPVVPFDFLRAGFSHKIVVFSEMKTAPFQNRTFLNACVCQRLANGVWVLAAVPLASHARLAPAEERHALRAEAMRCFRCTPAEGAC